MQEISYKDTLIAIKISTIAKGSNPITKNDEPLQIVSLKHPAKTVLKAHMHKPTKRETNRLQECLVVKSGKIRVDLYSDDKVLFKKIFLSQGQSLLVLRGGIAITVVQDCEVLEFKNGPFKEDKVLI